jgi:aminopeptidase
MMCILIILQALAKLPKHSYIRRMILEEIDYTAYAELLIRTGINLQKGQNLIIQYDINGSLLARRCAETAYEQGAGIVEMKLQDPHILKSRINAQTEDEQALSRSPGWTERWQDTVVKEGWGYLALSSFEDVGLLAGSNQKALMYYEKQQQMQVRRFRDAITGHEIPWCVAGVPGPVWAENVLGEGKTAIDLWRTLEPILLLDRKNPAGAWKEKAATLIERSDKLNSLKLDALRFEDEGTDITIGLLSTSVWTGGPENTGGILTMPNIPTEEVFTTPDRLRAEGTVRVTRPVEVRGTLVEGAELTFRDGILVDFRAGKGRDALAGYIETDPGARRLGEVALVGEDSPIAGSGFNFNSILYDENASCHIALGSGYVSCLSNSEELNNDEKKEAAGCNVSLVHTDFMIGSSGTTVTGISKDGRETPIIRKGLFVF